MTFFKDAATETFNKVKLTKFFLRLGMMLFSISDSIYSSDSLKKAPQDLFGDKTSLFAPALIPGHSQISTRGTVTSSVGYAETMTLISNYYHPQGRNEAREEDSSKDMLVRYSVAVGAAEQTGTPKVVMFLDVISVCSHTLSSVQLGWPVPTAWLYCFYVLVCDALANAREPPIFVDSGKPLTNP